MSSPIEFLNPLAGIGNARIRTPGSSVGRPIDERFAEYRNVLDFSGVDPTGVADSTDGIQEALDTLGEGTFLFFPPGTYSVSEKLRFYNCQTLTGRSSAFYPDGERAIIRYTGASGIVIGSDDPTTPFRNVVLQNIEFDGGAGADLVVDFTMVGYSRIDGCNIRGSKSAVVGMKIDDLTTGNTAYWNEVVSSRFWVSGTGASINLRITGGANYSRVWNCFFGYAKRGVQVDNNAVGTSIHCCGFQGVTSNEEYLLYIDAPLTSAIDCFLEHTSVSAVHVTTSGSLYRFGNRYGGALADKMQDNGFAKFGVDYVPDETVSPTRFDAFLHAGRFSIRSEIQFTTVATADIDNPPIAATGSSTIRFFGRTTTTGTRDFRICPGDGTTTPQFQVEPATGNVFLRGGFRSLDEQSQINFPNSTAFEFLPASGSLVELCLGPISTATSAQIRNSSGVVSVRRADGSGYCEVIMKQSRKPFVTVTFGAVNTGINFDASEFQRLVVTGSTNFVTAGIEDGRCVTLFITADASGPYNLTWPAGWSWVGSAPATIAANDTAKLTLRAFGTTDSAVFAEWVT